MDLLHYAMVGGMPAEDLPDEDILAFFAPMEVPSDSTLMANL